MATQNPWLSPLQRGYQQIKQRLIEKLLALKDDKGKPLITDTSEGNILVLILSLFSGIAEVIHVYIDNLARESFFSSARRYDSLVKHGRLVDYHPKAATAALCDVVFTRPFTESNNSVTFPAGLTFSDSLGNPWVLQSTITLPSNSSQVTGVFVQHQLFTGALSGTTYQDKSDGIVKATMDSVSSKLVEHLSSTQVTVGGVSYTEVETFAYSKPTDKHFILQTDESGTLVMIFGDGVYGFKPSTGLAVKGSCYLTQGSKGNIEPAAITGSYEGCSYSNFQAGGGSDYEDFDTLKRRIPLSTKTLGVAVTKQDYIDLALQIGEVSQAALEYICGRKLNIYISPVGGGVAPSGVCTRVKNYLALHAPLNTWLNVVSAGISNIVLDVDVVGRPSYKEQDIKNGIISALAAAYPSDGPIGGKVRLSDIYALIDNVPSVDYLHLNKFYVMPWPKAIFGNAQLKVTGFNLEKTNGTARYLVEMVSANRVRILPYDNITTFDSNAQTSYQQFEGDLKTEIAVNYPQGFQFNIKFDGQGFKEGYKYEFTVSDANADYDKSGFNIPVFNASDLTLHITETL